MSRKIENKENKENFCAPCAMAIPAALGIGGVAAGSGSGGKDRKLKNKRLWSSIAVLIVSVILFFYFKYRCTKCK